MAHTVPITSGFSSPPGSLITVLATPYLPGSEPLIMEHLLLFRCLDNPTHP